MSMDQPFVSRPQVARPEPEVAKAYRVTEQILWAVAILMCLGAVVAIHSLPEARASAERQAVQEITQESRTFCEARGLPAGTPAHSACVHDLGQIRANQERRMADALAPF